MSEKKIYIATIQIAVESEGEDGYCEDLLSAALTENLMGIGVIKDWQYAKVHGKQSKWEPVECPVGDDYEEGYAFGYVPDVVYNWDELAEVNKEVVDILVRKEAGIDCTEEESGILKKFIVAMYIDKGYNSDNIDNVYKLIEAVAHYFPIETSEASETIDAIRGDY